MRKITTPPATPLPALDHAGLMALVKSGDVGAVRRYFDESLHGRPITHPDWQHLRTAITGGHGAMARLLVTWGAHPTRADVQELIAARGTHATHDVLALRLAGVRVHDLPTLPAAAPLPAAPASAPASGVDFDVEALPAEWRHVLATIHARGAPEAVIAGGALRDTYNGRPVKDVDIFLAERFMNKRFIKKIFSACGLKIHTQTVSGMYKDLSLDIKPATAAAFNTVSTKNIRDDYGDIFEVKEVKEGAQAWSVIAGPDKTEYNIVFIKGEFGKTLRHLQAQGRDHHRILMERMDIGLCQICYTGTAIKTLQAYQNDVRDKTVTLVRPNDSCRAHVERVLQKYPDFAPCHNIARMLGLTLHHTTTITATATSPVTITKTSIYKKPKSPIHSHNIYKKPKNAIHSYNITFRKKT